MYVYPILSLEEAHMPAKRKKTQNVSEDVEVENTDVGEENVGTEKGILKGSN